MVSPRGPGRRNTRELQGSQRFLLSCGLHTHQADARLLLGCCPRELDSPTPWAVCPMYPQPSTQRSPQPAGFPRLHFLQIKQIARLLWTKHTHAQLCFASFWLHAPGGSPGSSAHSGVSHHHVGLLQTPAPPAKPQFCASPGNPPRRWHRLLGARTFSWAPGDPDGSTKLVSLQKGVRVPFRPCALLNTVSSEDPTDPTPQAHRRLGQERGREEGLWGGCRSCPRGTPEALWAPWGLTSVPSGGWGPPL